MSDIFISHTEEDGPEAIGLASGLEEAGYSTWYYERDATPGLSYLQQVVEAIGQCQVLMLIISKVSVTSNQVDRELIHAFETRKGLIPLLKDVTFVEFERLKPDWKLVLGPSVAEPLSNSNVDITVQRLIHALEGIGVQAAQEEGSRHEPSDVFVRIRLEPQHLLNEFRPFVGSGSPKCSYRLVLEGDVGPWLSARIVVLNGGLFVNLREVPSEALVQLEVAHKGRTWKSQFVAVAIINVLLEVES